LHADEGAIANDRWTTRMRRVGLAPEKHGHATDEARLVPPETTPARFTSYEDAPTFSASELPNTSACR